MHNEKNHLHDDRIGGRFNGKAVLKLIQNDIKKKPIEIIRTLRKEKLLLQKKTCQFQIKNKKKDLSNREHGLS